ncbi:MAG: diaminopimelate epimerase [Oscillospiraceae bacterium]|nr:diaminopimelate epimerase [Oscillospiraceae bacterium]
MLFVKMQGAGNDYIYITENVENPGELSKKVSDRHLGLGSDGLVMILPSDIADFRMRIFNADGSEAMMCGNATRCVGKYVYEKGLTEKSKITLETNSGVRTLWLNIENGKVKSVKVDMGKPILEPKEIPISCCLEKFINQPIEVLGEIYYATAVSMGNPHCVVFFDDIDCIPLEKIGPAFENHKFFPSRVNTEFIQIIDEKTLKMRVWERGSGETFACGTGACAAVVASVLNNKCKKDEEISIILRGGVLKITYTSEDNVIKNGPAEFVFETNLELEEIFKW